MGPARLFLVTVVLLRAAPARALDPVRDLREYRHDRWGAEEGFGHSADALVQSADGYLWIGTTDGLFRFDGVSFERVDLAAATNDQNVMSLHQDRRGRLWVGLSTGLVALDGGRARPFGEAQGLPQGGVYALDSTPDGTLWVGTDDGLFAWRGDRFQVDGSCAQTPRYRVRDLATGRDGALWVAATRDGGLRRIGGGRCTLYGVADGLADANVIAVHEDRGGTLWVGTQKGLCRREGARFRCQGPRDGLSHEAVRSLASDRDGNLWVGTVAGGLDRLRDERFAALSVLDGLMGDRVFDVLEDREGSIWFATRGGLERLQDAPFVPLVTAAGVLRGSVRTLLGTRDGALWLGVEGEGLRRIRGAEDHTFTMREGLPDGVVSSLLEDEGGALWVGNSLGLARLESGRFRSFDAASGLTDDNVRVLMRDRAGAVWVGTDGGGLFRWDGARFVRHLPGANVHALHQDRAGALWVGTSRGLVRLDGERATTYTTADGLSSDVVLSFAEDDDGSLWIGTGNGLSRRRAGAFRAYTGKRGLFDERVNYLHDDGAGNLWMTSGVGVFRARKADFDRLDAGQAAAVPFARYGISDGLPSTECAGYRQPAGWGAPDGRLYIPTLRGVAVLDPRRAERPAVPMPIRIDHLLLDGRALAMTTGLRLPPGGRSLELRWAGLSFRAPARNHFRYRLEPYDADWLEAGPRTSAIYGELPPGSYRFRVIGASSDGLWNQTGDSFAFSVAPRFYQTLWFRLLVGAALISLALALHRLRTRSLRARFAAVLAERGRIARDLHDTFDQGLAAAGMQIQVAAQTLGRAPEQARASLDRARRALEATLEEGRRSVWALRSQALEQAGLPEAFVGLCRDLGSGTRAAIRVDVEGTPRRLRPRDEEHVLRIGAEAITNALRHGSPRAIVVRLGFWPDRFSLRVRDDGGGFDPRAGAVGLGLRGMHERATEMGASITVDSRPGEETEIALELPAAAKV